MRFGAKGLMSTLMRVRISSDAPRCTVQFGALDPRCTMVQVHGDPNEPSLGAGAAGAPCVTLARPTPAQSLRTHRPTAVLRRQEQALRSRLRSRPLNAPFVIVLRSSRCALGIPLHPLTPVPLQAPTLH